MFVSRRSINGAFGFIAVCGATLITQPAIAGWSESTGDFTFTANPTYMFHFSGTYVGASYGWGNSAGFGVLTATASGSKGNNTPTDGGVACIYGTMRFKYIYTGSFPVTATVAAAYNLSGQRSASGSGYAGCGANCSQGAGSAPPNFNLGFNNSATIVNAGSPLYVYCENMKASASGGLYGSSSGSVYAETRTTVNVTVN
jgi:hypothetical protein